MDLGLCIWSAAALGQIWGFSSSFRTSPKPDKLRFICTTAAGTASCQLTNVLMAVLGPYGTLKNNILGEKILIPVLYQHALKTHSLSLKIDYTILNYSSILYKCWKWDVRESRALMGEKIRIKKGIIFHISWPLFSTEYCRGVLKKKPKQEKRAWK